MRHKFASFLICLGLTTSAFADMGHHLLGTWQGKAPIISSKLIMAANGDFNKSLVDMEQTITINAAKNGLCMATVDIKAPSNILFNMKGQMVSHRLMSNMPCLYKGHLLKIAADNGASRDCTVHGNSMNCFVINSRPEHQAASIIHLTKKS